MFWSNADNDKLLQQADAAPGHGAERIKLYLQQQAIFMKELPSIPLFALPTLTLYNPNLQNVQSYPGGIIINWQDLYLPKK